MPRPVLYTNCNLTECNMSWVRGGDKTPREHEVDTASDRTHVARMMVPKLAEKKII
jgi:hypothetical protein